MDQGQASWARLDKIALLATACRTSGDPLSGGPIASEQASREERGFARADRLVQAEGNVVPLRTRGEWELWHRRVAAHLRNAGQES